MKNDLFNQTLLKKYSKNFSLNPSKQDLIKEHNARLEAGALRSETENYLYFYDNILQGILDYSPNNVLFDKKEDYGRGKSEFVLQDENEKKFMIIELKGQGIDPYHIW